MEKQDQKKVEAAPEGPPPDLVHGRGQRPAEAPKGNLSASHGECINTASSADQVSFGLDPQICALLSEHLSERRLLRYASAAEEAGTSREAIYLWNHDLCEAFQFPLHIAEVVCRNTILKALMYRGDKWYENKTFLDLLSPPRRRYLEDAIYDEKERHGDIVDSHHIASALSFGFWEHLTTKKFQRILFPRGIQKVFVHAPWDAKLEDLHSKIETTRRWRNRIAHHNAIFDKRPASKYQEILDLIRWTSPDLESWVAERSRVSQTINQKPEAL